ncbi:MAG: PEP/pyruvate-binding domain-containing protein [Candidatus Cloacimonetes bacterium]|nr:PEP/pyruvate-binding domain-containing protein [Candidatus Cloacimonadota bacterium]
METLESKALAENLAVTRVAEITLDDEAKYLLSCTTGSHGINQRCSNFLNELYHPFVNPEVALSLMRQSILGDLWFYTQGEDKNRKFLAILAMFERIDNACQSAAHKRRVIQEYLDFLGAITDHGGIPVDSFNEVFSKLQSWVSSNPQQCLEISGSFRKSLSRCAPNDPQAFALIQKLLIQNLEFWQQALDIEKWCLAEGGKYQLDNDQLSKDIGEEFYRNWFQVISHATQLQYLMPVPAYSDVAARYREVQKDFSTLSGRIHYIFLLLRMEGMAELRDHLLWDLNRQLADLGGLEADKVLELLDSVFSALQEFSFSHRSIVLDCALSLGKTLLSGNQEELSERFRQKYIALGFTPPGEIRIGTDWQLEVDKNHIKHIRVSLALIAINPLKNKDLLSHLTISLHRLGIFVSDTDLFQKDVSAFLNADIKPLVIQVKHLLRLFPVFFNEIGAEGEIRDSSTSLDELSHRKDRLIHFFRKQVHTESNNTHINLIKQILNYWIDLNPLHLKGIIPQDVALYIKVPDALTQEQSQAVNAFLNLNELTVDELLGMSWQRVQSLFDGLPEDICHKRFKHLLYCHFLLKDKYNLDPYDIVKFLSKYNFFDAREQNRLRTSLIRKDYESSIRQMLGYIGNLSQTILDPKPTTSWENIYFKRHIAAGIPSMYGTYREAKLEAVGMIFRLENVIRKLFENSINQLNLHYVTGKTLLRIMRILELYDYAMRQEMVTNDAFSSALQMLSSATHLTNLSLDQYLDIFNLLKDSVNEIISEYFYRFYDKGLMMQKQEHKTKEAREKFAEEFYRNLLSGSFIVQGLDSFVTQILQSLSEMKNLFAPADIPRVMSYDPDKLFFHLSTRNSRIENQVLLGSKAYFLKRMYQYEFPIPTGFVMTTELFRNRNIINTHPEISSEFDALLLQNLNKLEHSTGLVFGDPQRPLLISVRSGAPMSLPGAMDTFLNIGMNDDITLKISQRPNYGWTAWDCYRRLIQSWGMAFGINRDLFDEVIIKYKKKYNVKQKTQFSPEQMRLMIDDYKEVLSRFGIALEQDPFTQLYKSISHVLDSWNTERAISYRKKLHIADEWGTAVIVQKMVLGNISLDSGTRVLFTHAPWNPEPGICLNGDFTLCSQGEDVGAGLVHPLPISEAQRLQNQSAAELSLEKDFPAIYNRLCRYINQLIVDKNYPHQEMEFTFEGSQADQLFILQTRNQVIHKAPEYNVLGTLNAIAMRIGTGIGISKGAVNGIIVISKHDIARFANSGAALILVRPDTVPDDMELLFDCQGLLTSRGGVTSHAAVTATRLGLIGIVNCKDLVVNESNSTCTIGEKHFQAGDKITLDATSGNIYPGYQKLQSVHSLK